MKTLPKHLRLYKEHRDSYELHDTRDKKNFHVAKRDLDLQMHAKLAKMAPYEEEKPQKLADGGEAQPDSTPSPDPAPAPAPVVVNVGQPAPQQGAMSFRPPAPTPTATSVATGQPIDANAPQPAPEAVPTAPQAAPERVPAAAAAIPQVPKIPTAPTLSQQGKANEALSEQGIKELNNAEAAQQQRDVGTLDTANQGRQDRLEAFQKTRADLDAQNTQLFNAVIQQDIKPDQWWTNRSTAGKISTAIGVILGGIGAGLQHSTTNQALQVMQDHIKNDIEAQKANLGKTQTLFSMNLQRYRDAGAAFAATEQQMNAMLAGQLQLNAARSGSARAKANADYAIGQLRNHYLLEAPNLALQDYKVNELHELNGSTSPPSAANHILGTPPPGAKTSGAPEGSVPRASGPGAGDELREQNVLQGKPMPVDPARYGTGVNLNKLTALKVTGLIDKEAGTKATEEYGKYIKLQHELQEADSVFNIAAQNATLRGRIARGVNPHALALLGGAAGAAAGAPLFGIGAIPGATAGAGVGESIGQGIKHLSALGDEKTKQYTAVVDPFVDKLAKDVTGRSTPISIEKLTSVMAEQGDDLKTLAIKRAKLHDLLKSSYTFPTLVEHNLVNPQDPILNLDSERR